MASETYSFFGFTFLLLSASNFQLPHYLNALFPHFRITKLKAKFLNKNTRHQAVEMKYLLRVY